MLRTIAAAVPLDKIFRLHTPTYQTEPPSCIVCGAPIAGLKAWLEAECLEIHPRQQWSYNSATRKANLA